MEFDTPEYWQQEYEYQLSLEAEELANMEADEQYEYEREMSMNTDNIISIMTLDYEDQVNNYLELGWLLLGFVPQPAVSELDHKHEKYVKYIMGYPRQELCGAASFGHTTPKKYDHEKGVWYCVHCREKGEAPEETGAPF